MASSTTMMSAIDAIGKYEITEMFTELSVVCQTKSEVDDIDISSLSNSIRNITIALKDASNRERITEKECRVLDQCLQLYFQFKNKDKIMSTLIELFRCLRNVCASNRNNQDLIARCSDLLENIFLSIFDVINCCKEQNSHLQEDNTCFQILRCGMQFLGNFVSGNNTNKIYVWKKLNAKFGFLLSQQDAVLAQYSCMLLYNCLYALPKHQEQLVLSEDCNDITNALMKLTMVQESEWGLYVLELLLGVESFLLTAYDKISEEARLFLLDLLQDGISKSDTLSPVKTCGFKIASSNLNFLSENFKCKAERILQYASEDQENTLQPVEIMRLLAVLCCSSACESYRYLLQKDSGLLETTLVLLNSVHKLGKMGNANFAPIEKLAAVINPDGDDLTSHPAYGIKRNLIRLVGNLCWENVENQNKVRIMDGIPLLLDCCKIDARNPYIIQWVVFAIHNLCDNNLENQSVIASMQYEGVVESKTMEDLGICISEIEDKIKAASINSQNQSDNDTKTDTVHKESFNDPSVNANDKQSNFKVDNCTTADRAVNDILDLFS